MTDEEAIKRIKYLQQDECNCEECTKDKEAYEIVLNLIEKKDKRINELEKTLDERFIHITGARTVYARLMSLDKEIIVRDDLKLRNEIEQNIKDEEKLKVELKKKDKIIDGMARSIANYDSQLVINRFKDKEHVKEFYKEYFEKEEG